MSAHHFPKSPATNESNIPIRKKSNIKLKRSRRCSQLPELQKYIETIIKASDEYDSEEVSERDKFPRDRKYVGYSVFKGFESKAKKNKIKNDTNDIRSKIKKPNSDAVSRDDKINKNFVPEFEDPRNWNLQNSKNLGPNVEIEKFLKKFYPNPYQLNKNELKNSESEKDDARDGTLPDVVISKANPEVDKDNDIVPADNDIEPRERGIDHKNLTSDPRMEKSYTSDQNSYSKLGIAPAPFLPNPSVVSKTNICRSNCSRVSSFESFRGIYYKGCRISSKKQKNEESKTKFNSSQSDYDIGKLELLNTADTEEESNGEEKTENKTLKADESNEVVDVNSLSSINVDEMKEIYEEISKITDSFQFVNSKQETELKNINKFLNEIIKEDAEQNVAYSKSRVNIDDQPGSSSTTDRKFENAEGNLDEVSPAEKILNELTPYDEVLLPSDKYVVLDMERKEEDPNPEVDEVLDFMYNCLKNFNKRKKLQKTNPVSQGRDEKLKKSIKNIENEEEKPTTSKSDLPISQNNTIENLVGIQTKCRGALNEIDKREHPVSRQIPQSVTMPLPPISDIPEGEPEAEESLQVLSIEAPMIPTVEIQNELGGYSEITRDAPTSRGATSPKSLLPLPMKMKKSKVDTYRTLKNILKVEEEMLMMSEQQKTSEEVLRVENQVFIINDPSVNALSVMGGFNNSSSNLVICINPHTQYLRSVNSIKSTIPLSVPIREEAGIPISSKQLEYPKLSLEKLPLPAQDRYSVLKRMYDYKREIIMTVNQPAVAYTARQVGLKAVTNHSKSTEEYSIRSSEQLVRVVIREPVSGKTKNYKSSKPAAHTEGKKSIKPELKEETKLGKGSCSAINLLVTSSEDGDENVKLESLETEMGKENYRKKVHELLLRAFNLQKKLQRYLQIMTHLEQEEKFMGAVRSKIKSEIDVKPEYSIPLVHWHLKSSVNEKKTTVDKLQLVPTVDSGTVYDPPVGNTCEQGIGTGDEELETSNTGDKNDDDDDRSSNNSFKSSNDMSESSENPLTKKESGTKKRSRKKIFNEIESYRQSYAGKDSEDQRKEDSNEKSLKWLSENQLTHYEPKTPAKVLKTVFKGKKSSTELTIGLKDVPMTKVGNISVEKTKFSPNHTKISICITRENSVESHKNFSSYIFDRIRPSLSTCLTDYSKLNDEMSKCSQSPVEESEDDEDDYKSVGSTLGDSDGEEKKPEIKDKPVEISAPQSFTKHRFDFYRKMNLDPESSKSKNNLINSMCRYKELEPLKQALTEMQIRMRSIKRESGYNSCDYYERALKLAKMSAGFCQNCGNRAVIPNDTFGYYRTLVPQKSMHNRRIHNLKSTITPKPSYYSFRSNNAELNHPFCDVNVRQSSCSLHPMVHSNRTILRSSLHDMPILFEGM